ncbi:TPA: hypothetical protein ACH1J3_002877 [Citrobacter werkmanii]
MAGVLMLLPQISSAITGTTSLTATFNATVESGTCNSALHDDGGNAVATLDFGNLYISELSSTEPTKSFSIVFSECQAVTAVTVTTSDSSLCSADAFANVSGNAQGIAAELWSGEPDTGKQFVCSDSSGQTFDVVDDTTVVPMSIRMVPTDVALKAGSFDTTLILMVTYL